MNPQFVRAACVLFILSMAIGTGCVKSVVESETGNGDGASSGGSGTERVVAEVGVGEKGRATDDGVISVHVNAYFRSAEKLTFLQVTQALELYKAAGNGKGPATHEAFMEEVIKANRIQLPKLPAGHEYVYDPEEEQLMVERPAN